MLIAIVVALAAAGFFAASTSLQHHAAGSVSVTDGGTLHLLRRLVGRPAWVLGAALGAVGFVLHGVALNRGVIAVVQPVMLTGVVLAVPLRAALSRRVPHRDELLAVSVTTAGLALFLAMTPPAEGDPTADATAAAVLTVAALSLSVLLVTGAKRVATEQRQALLLGVSSGVVFGITAGLLKYVVSDLHSVGLTETLLTWRPWTLLIAGVSAVAVNQRAYQVARLADSMPVLNVVDVLVAVAFGRLVFGELSASSPGALVTQAVALVIVTAGLVAIARLDAEVETGSDPVTGAPATVGDPR